MNTPSLNFPIIRQPQFTASQLMLQVMFAMLPSIAVMAYFWGIGIFIQLTLASISALFYEFIVMRLRQRKLQALGVYSSLLSAWLLAVCVPVIAPWWLIVTGVGFAIILGKHVFGGVGMNIFNPAIVGFCVLYSAFAYQMSLDPTQYVTIAVTVKAIFQQANVDSLAGATLLSALKVNGVDNLLINFSNPNIITSLSWLIGATYLWLRSIADWRISLTFLTLFSLLNFIFYLADSSQFMDPIFHLITGATLFSAGFILTDPVTTASSRQGQIVFAILVAVLAVIIRQLGNMPDSLAYAIILGNLCVPLIDEYTKPQYGDEPDA